MRNNFITRSGLFVTIAVISLMVFAFTGHRATAVELAGGDRQIEAQAQQGTVFSYQGQLKRNGNLVNDSCNLRFSLWDAAVAGAQKGSTQTINNVDVVDGLFMVQLDFGNQFTGDVRWLETAVQCSSDGGFTALNPRQALTPTPYALSLRPGTSIIGVVPNGGAALLGQNTATTDFSKGVSGRSDASGAYGVYGSSIAGQGVRGDSITGYGVVGYSSGGDAVRGLTISGKSGVYGQNNNTAAYSTGVWGRADAGGAFGVYGSSAAGQAVRGDSTTGIAIAGAVSNANGWAGYFSGGRGVSMNVLQIRGGSDLAEPFEVSDAISPEPGSLLVIDEANPGQLKMSSTPYDSRVAGIVSGAGGVQPGLTLYQEGLLEGDTQVALAGRVYVWAEATTGAIQPGDLLTTSAIPGHAMKVTDFDRAQGAVIGKAMSELSRGQGLVLVLVNLQ